VAGEEVGSAVFGACIPDRAKETETEPPRFVDSEQFDLIWSAVQRDKKLLLSQSIALTNQENSAFWPIYGAFQEELKKTALTYFNLLGEYAVKYNALSDEDAGSMLNAYLDMEAERIALKKSYVDKFGKILPPRKMLRYFQLENKIETSLKYEFAQNVQVVKQ